MPRDTAHLPRRLRHSGEGSSPHRPAGGVREAALLILTQVETGGARADYLLERWLPVFSDSHRDRAFLMQLVNGTLRQRGYLDWILGHLVHAGLASITPALRNVLRLSLFQIEFLERVPPRAAVHEGVELARRHGHEGTARLANAVLREAMRRGADIPRPDPASDPVAALAVLHSHPEWIARRWVERYGAAEAEALMKADNRVPPITLRVNTRRADRRTLLLDLMDEGLHPEPGELYPDALRVTENVLVAGLRAFREGFFQVQDESSCLVTPLLGAQPGETVLDLCAAPGGKCTHLAEIVGPEGRVVGVDVSTRGLARAMENVRRLRLENVLLVRGDGRHLELAPVDRVLVDAPCSGLGVLARRADARWRRRESDIARFQELQCALLERAADLARPGGTVLYATCTLEPEENEDVVRKVAARRSDLVPVPVAAERPVPADAVAEDGTFHLFPHRHGCDGAFAARFAKRRA